LRGSVPGSCFERKHAGLDHFKAYIWSAVVAYNLVLFARFKPAWLPGRSKLAAISKLTPTAAPRNASRVVVAAIRT
jgi:hypothetical protein